MKLYYTQGACSLVARIIIHEVGLTSEYEAVDLHTKKTATGKDFNQINPKGSVPVLQLDDGDILTENAAILQYLADSTNALQLLPEKGNFKRYHVLEWLNYMATEMHKSFGPLFNPKIPQDLKDNLFIPTIKSKIDYINTHLNDKKYLLGEHFTLPDAYLFVMLRWAGYFHIDINEFSNINRYFTQLNHRSSIKEALREEGFH